MTKTLLVLFALLLAGSLQAQSTSEKLTEARAKYGDGDFATANSLTDDLLMTDWSMTPEERSSVYILKARLLNAFNQKDQIGFWLKKAVVSFPAVALDPLTDPPELVSLLQQLKKDYVIYDAKESPVPARSEGSFIVGVLPFGIGHLDAGEIKEGSLFLATETLLVVTSQTLPGESSSSQATGFLAALSFLGTYSYELLDMLPVLYTRDASATHTLKNVMNVAPFGAAQAKNGQLGKAFGFAALQSVLLTVGAMTEETRVRNIAYGTLGLSWVFSAIDGFSNFNEQPPGDESASLRPLLYWNVAHNLPEFGLALDL